MVKPVRSPAAPSAVHKDHAGSAAPLPIVEASHTAPLLLVLVGPTGSGKTALSLALAQHLGGEIVSCDSVSVYRGMDLGSAKPTREEQTRVPHHLIDVVTPEVDYTAGDYGRAARAAVQAIAERGRVPIVAGGTGLYLRALLDGLSAVPSRNPPLRARLQRIVDRAGPARLHTLVRRLDPVAADRIHANDLPKLIRAAEVSLLSRRPMSEALAHDRPKPLEGFRVLQVGLSPPRQQLYERIDARCTAMFTNGLVKETRGLVARYGEARRSLGALGYAQAVRVLQGHITQAQAITATRQGHRNYAKRQGTWFRKDPRIQWLNTFGQDALTAILQAIEAAR